MKLNLLKTALLLLTLSIFSCSKDNDAVVPAPIVNKYRLIEETLEETKFIYDTQGRLIKETDLVDVEKCTYEYNAQNKLITYKYKTADDLVIENFDYRTDGQLNEKIITSKNLLSATEAKSKKIYIYNANNLLIEVKQSFFNNVTSVFESETTVNTYTYDASNRLKTNILGYTYSYDGNSNLILFTGIDKSGRPFTFQYTYNDKINPFFNLRPIVNPNVEIINPKNIATQISTGTFAFNYNFQYEYNDGGYPTKQINGSDARTFKYQKI